jgi:hypothetical protein
MTEIRKAVSWEQLEPLCDFLKQKYNKLVNLMQMKEDSDLTVQQVEFAMTRIIVLVFEQASKILHDNEVLKKEEQKQPSFGKIDVIMKTAMNLQKLMMSQSLSKEWDTKVLVGSLKKEIEASLGESFSLTLSQEIDSALEVLTANLEDNFS